MAFSSVSFLPFLMIGPGITCGRPAVGPTVNGPQEFLPGAEDVHIMFRRHAPSPLLARMQQMLLHRRQISAPAQLKACG
jgi:hypothetical protein